MINGNFKKDLTTFSYDELKILLEEANHLLKECRNNIHAYEKEMENNLNNKRLFDRAMYNWERQKDNEQDIIKYRKNVLHEISVKHKNQLEEIENHFKDWCKYNNCNPHDEVSFNYYKNNIWKGNKK